MDSIAVKIIRPILRSLARLTLARHMTRVIGVTGSVGKTSTKLAIAAVLEKKYRVRSAAGNLNNEIGLSLAVLGDWTPEELKRISRDQPAGTAKVRKLFFWLKVCLVSMWRIVAGYKHYPEILILEYGADRPGDILRLVGIARPEIAIVTAIGDVPVHVEFYDSPDDVAREKGRLIERLPTTGFAILNADDEMVVGLADRTRAHVITYGFSKDADLRAVNFENRVHDDLPDGISFKFEYEGSLVPVHIPDAFGRANVYAATAAASVGLIFGMNLVTISEALTNYVPARSRMELLVGIKRTLIIDDSYNASPLSMYAALETLSDLPAKRKIAVLGDMLEIGKYTIEAHENIGQFAAKAADVIVTVGARAKFIAETAKEAGMKKTEIFSFDTAEEAAKALKEIVHEGDLVLVKGSHAMRLEVVVEELKAEPFATAEA